MRVFPSTIAAAIYGAVGFPLFQWAANMFAAKPSGDGWTAWGILLMIVGFGMPASFCCFEMQAWWRSTKEWWRRDESEGGAWELTGLTDSGWLKDCLPAWGRIVVMLVSLLVSLIILNKFGITL